MSSSRARVTYLCSACGASSAKWTGQCGECEAWNTLQAATRASGARRSQTSWAGANAARVVDAGEIELATQHHVATGIAELDRTLGGGVVAGSVALIGGDPGIGKSTLLLQMVAQLRDRALSTVYVTGEESLQQVALRARRLGLSSAGLKLLAETQLEAILELIAAQSPVVVVIDSIQTMVSDEVASAPGSVAQVRECAARLTRFAKQRQCSVFLVGHVTKEGALAGPRVLEHMVDAVLYFETQADQRFRVVRSVKNRFGAANELGIFAMTDKGLRGVSNPSAIFLSRHAQPVPGSVVTVTREGTRPLLVEIQALVDTSSLANPRRVALGLDATRMAMLLAVLHRHAGVALGDQDVFANVVGGVRITETGADLALVLAIVSSFRSRIASRHWIAFGELGLAGEIRPVANGEERLQAAAQHGFTSALIPSANKVRRIPQGLTVRTVDRLEQAIDALFEGESC